MNLENYPINFKVQKAFHFPRITSFTFPFLNSNQPQFWLKMEDKQPNEPTDIEMKPVNVQQEEKEEKLPYKKGDMYIWFLTKIHV